MTRIGTRFYFARNGCGWDSRRMELLERADRLFIGELPIEEHHPFATSGELAEVVPGVAFVDAFANSAAVETGDGLVVVDTSGVFTPRPSTPRCASGRAAGSTRRSSPTGTSTTCSAST